MATRKQQPHKCADGRGNEAWASEYIGVSPATLRAWRAAMMGPPYVKVGLVWYYEDDLETWIRSHRIDPGASS